MNYLVNGNRAEPLVPMSGLVFDHTIDSTNEPWDVFDISVTIYLTHPGVSSTLTSWERRTRPI